MSWVAITDEQLNSQKLAPLIEALRTAALGDEQTDPVDVMVGDVVREIRKAISAGGVEVDAVSVSTIPPSLLRMAGRLILWEAKGRLEMDREYDREDHREDLKTLERLRMGKEPVEPPTNAETVDLSTGVGVAVAGSRTRVATRQGLDGLL
jgi:hypothetical protein